MTYQPMMKTGDVEMVKVEWILKKTSLTLRLR